MACQESPPDVIEVLARQAPNLLAQRNRRQQVPLYMAMTNKNHRIPFKTLKLLLEMHSEPLNWGQTWALALDSANEDSTELLQYMVDNYKQNQLTIHAMFLEGLLNGGRPIGVARTRVLTTFSEAAISYTGEMPAVSKVAKLHSWGAARMGQGWICLLSGSSGGEYILEQN
jgi:hypothetical protein